MKDNSKIFKIILSVKFFWYFLSQFYQQIQKCVFFFNSYSKKLQGGGDICMYGRKEIYPSVLQDIGPLGTLPKKLGGDRGWQRYRQTKKRRQAGRKTDLQTDGDRQMERDNRRQTEGDSRTDIAV